MSSAAVVIGALRVNILSAYKMQASPFIIAFLSNAKFLYRHFDMYGMALLFNICILNNSKFSLVSKYLGTNRVVVKRVRGSNE